MARALKHFGLQDICKTLFHRHPGRQFLRSGQLCSRCQPLRAQLLQVPQEEDETELRAAAPDSQSVNHNNLASGLGFQYSPFLGHHQNALDQNSLCDLGANALEQPQNALIRVNELQHLPEALEGLALP